MTDPSEPIRRVVVVAKTGAPQGPRIARELGDWLESRSIEVAFDDATAAAIGRGEGVDREWLPSDLDLAIVAGGDGTLLSIARSAAPQRIPILGVNFGGLGFLTELQPDEMFSGLEAVLSGRFELESRDTLRVANPSADADTPRVERLALLNDVVITKSALARMITVEVRVDGARVATYTSDGLIVATPTGSTAYNLSAGGPILDPRMSAFVIAPICPHTMNYRPLVVPASVEIEVVLHSDDEEVYLTLDGQVGFPFAHGRPLRIDRHPDPVQLVRVNRRSYFEVLRRKLGWGARA